MNQEEIKSFRAIYKARIGKRISKQEALELGNRLLWLVRSGLPQGKSGEGNAFKKQ